MLFNKEIEGLHDDGFEGSLNESHIFTEVFFENDRDTTNKRCLVTGVITFECDYGKNADMSLCSTSENSAIRSQVDSCNVKEDSRANSAPGCFSEGCALLMRNDHDVNGKRMKLSVDELSYSRPYSNWVLNSSAPSSGVVSGMSQPASQSVCHTVTCRLVESSSQGVTSSCYLLKRQAERHSGGEMYDRGVSKCKLQSLDGSDEKEVNASKAIASPVSQESSATKLLVASPSVTVAKKSGSLRCAGERMKPSSFGELLVGKTSLNRDSMKDPRPILRSHVQSLLRAAGWEIGRRNREDSIYGEFIYLSPWGGRPIREFRRAWNLCGQILCADRNVVVQEDGKQWTDMTHFWSDLSNTLIKIEEELNNKESTAVLAHRWYLLDPFANMVFIDKKLGTLRAGIAVKARRSLVIDTSAKDDTVLALKNMDTIGNQSERNSTNPICDSSMVRESALTVSEGIYHICNEKCGNRSAACFGQLQRGAGKALKGMPVYLSEEKCTRSTSTVSGTGNRRRDFSANQASTCLFEVPITSENANITCGGSETVSPHHDQNANSQSCNRYRSDNSEEVTLEVKSKASMGSSEAHKTFNEVNEVVENQLKGSLNDHLNCRSDGLTQSNDQNRIYVPLNTHVDSAFKPCWPSLVENSHFMDMVDAEVMQHSGFSEQCTEISKFKMNGAYCAADAILKKKGAKKSKRISEVKLLRLYRNNKLGPSTSYNIERPDNNRNSIQLESVGVEECFIVTNERTDRSCKKSFVCSSQHQSGKKQSRFRKFHQSSGNPKTSSQFSSEELNFVNITDESPLYIENESLHPEPWRQEVNSEKPETQNESTQRRSITCQLKDDDLLISAIIKNKTFRSTTKRSTGKMKSCKSEALRKRKSQKGSCRLLPRSLGKGGKHIEGKWFFGVRNVLSWLIDSGVVSVNEVIQYRNPKDDAVMKNGLVTRDGILCKCCNKVLSVSEFKIHAGFRLNRPCLNLFMESGKPFTLCQLEAWSAEYKTRKSATQTVQVEEMDQNDDSCGLCGDGGELICCDNCPSTFHQACLYSQELPEGSWYCLHCTCQICGDVVKEPLKSPGALKCSQCDHKYHEACLKQKGTCREVASDTWFCSESCQEVYFGLHSRIGFVNLLSDGFCWILLRCIHGDQRVHSAQRFVALKAECNSKLAVALTIMEECFLSMVDPRTGIDMIPHVLYNWGSQFARLNYCGFYTMVLEKNDVLMSVASIRIHGVAVAEMPLIATCSKYRRQGMCRRLMNSLEEMLKSFKVEKLVISAIPSLVEAWTIGFGFKPLEDSERKSLSNINLMVFPGTVWLKKPIYEYQATNQQGGSGHASPLIIDDPNETGACSQEGPIIESRKQSDGSYSMKEVDALTELRHIYSSNMEVDEDQDDSSPKHFSELSRAEPTSTIGGFQQGPVIESRKQSDGSSPVKEEGALTDIRHTNSSNMQVEEDQDGRLRKYFSVLSCEEPASTVRESQLEMVCHVESVVMYDERKLSLNEQLQETHMLQDDEK